MKHIFRVLRQPKADSASDTTNASFFRNVGAVSGARILSVFAQILVLPFIARHITAEEFGLVALAMSIVVFAQLLSDAGLGRSLVRQPEYDPVEWNSAFWLMVGVGLALSTLLALSGPLWSYVFGMPDVLGLIQVLAVIPFLQALSAVPNANLERADKFQVLAVIRIVSVVLSVCVVIVMASYGAGAWALVAQQVVLFGVITVGTFVVSDFRPSLQWSSRGLMKHVLFARDTIGASLVFTAQRQAPSLLLGYSLGAGALGVFSMAQRVLRLPQMGLTGPASQVTFVRMARVAQEPEKVGDFYVVSLRLFALAVIPPMFILAALGPVLFPVLLSDQWGGVAIVFALAAPGFALEAATSNAGVAFQAVGQTTLRLRMATERAILQVLALAIAMPFGIKAVALAITLFTVAYTPRLWQFLQRAAPFDWRAAAATLVWPALVAAGGWLIIAQFIAPVLRDAPLLFVLAGLAVLLVCYGLSAAVQFRDIKASIAALKAS